jgi:AcrR family transcriptional regulator
MKNRRGKREPAKRRKEDRPLEIRSAALQLFTELGFGGASIGLIAQRAGIAPSSIYRYYANKEDLFRAVVTSAGALVAQDHCIPSNLKSSVTWAATIMSDVDVVSVMRLLLIESQNFPTLANEWYEQVVLSTLNSIAAFIKSGQTSGEIEPGDPIMQAFTIFAPLIMTVIFQDSVPASPLDLVDLAEAHLSIAMNGLRDKAKSGKN